MPIHNQLHFLLLTKNGLVQRMNKLHKKHLKLIFFQKEICSPLTAEKPRLAWHFQPRFKTPSSAVISQMFSKASAAVIPAHWTGTFQKFRKLEKTNNLYTSYETLHQTNQFMPKLEYGKPLEVVSSKLS